MLRYFLIALVTAALPLCVSAQCPSTATTVTQPFVPPAPYRPASLSPWGIWYGSNLLWTSVPLGDFPTGDNSRLSAKLVYWRAGFDWLNEPDPELTVVARRLDSPAPLVWAAHAHAVKLPNDGTPAAMAMMTGISIPVAGRWEIAANYKGQTLSYIVSVRP